MKAYTRLFAGAIALGATLYSCAPENVDPKQSQNAPEVGQAEDHPVINPFCSDFDTLSLISEATATLSSSLTVNYNCLADCPKWGSVVTYNTPDKFVAVFRLATGWYMDFESSEFQVIEDFQLNQNLVPVIDTDWETFNPAVNPNSYQLLVDLPEIERTEANCFGFAARLAVVRTNFLGSVISASRRNLWIHNPEYNVQGNENFSPSPYVVPSCWTFCPPPADTICTDLTPSTACRDLTADLTGITGSVTYAWDNGATTPTINACPATNATYYTVTITANPSREILAVQTFCVPSLPPVMTVTEGDCRRCETSFSTTFTGCSTVQIHADCRALSNLRIGFTDCSTIKFDNLSGHDFTYNAPTGKQISAVWVKAGCVQSEDCPGCGPRVDNPIGYCTKNPGCSYVFN